MTYSRRQLYAFGETLGDSVTRKIAGRVVYGGGGGGGFIEDLAEDAGDFISDSADFVGDTLSDAGDILTGTVEAVGDLGSGLEDAVRDIGSGIDDAVNDVIPGGWTTVLSVVAGMYGVPIQYITAAGATKGSGLLDGEGFNLKGAVLGGASAYGAGSLGASFGAEGAAADAAATEAGTEVVASPVQTPNVVEGVPIEAGVTETATAGGTATAAGTNTATSAIPPSGLETLPTAANAGAASTTPTTAQSAGAMMDDVVVRNGAAYNPYTDPNSAMNMAGTGIDSVTAQTPPPTMMESIGNSISSTATELGEGVKNLTGFGDVPAGEAWGNLATDVGLSDVTPMGVAKGVAYTGLGLTALQALSARNQQDRDSGKIDNSEYLKRQAEIDANIENARKAVSMNPYRQDRAGAGLGRTLYGNNRTNQSASLGNFEQAGETNAGIATLAQGGEVSNYETPDTMMAGGITNQFRFANGGEVKHFRYGGEAIYADSPASFQPSENQPFMPIPAEDENNVIGGGIGYKVRDVAPAAPSAAEVAKTQALDSAKNAMAANPYRAAEDSPTEYMAGLGKTLYDQKKKFEYAQGGNVTEPRFLSGGGDGMSDSIKANIDGHTEARLADGEFVVPADVVSHLGNGSSKAGAKQLYDMMDRIRKARTGNKKQGKQINPHKFLPK